MSFMDFRARMLDEHEGVIDDNEIHRLFMKHVMHRDDDFDYTTEDVERAAARRREQSHAERQAAADRAVADARRMVNERLDNAERRLAQEPLKVDKPEFDYLNERKPLMDRTLGDIASGVARKARTFVRIALGSHRDT
jgi:hypothetical protein